MSVTVDISEVLASTRRAKALLDEWPNTLETRLRQAADWLAQQMDGAVTDGGGQRLGPEVLDQIALDLEQLYNALDERELSAGSAQARRLFS